MARPARGDGTFRSIGGTWVGQGPVALDIADLDGDRRLDVVTANAVTQDVSVLIGLGDGSFRPAVRYSVGGIARSVAIGDQNHDGRPDLAVVVGASSFALLLGNGNGTFQPSAGTETFALRPTTIVLRDFNSDGFDDVAVTCVGLLPPGTVGFTTGVISVYRSRPAGGFQYPVNYALTNGQGSLSAVDLNGDGRLDLVVGGAGLPLETFQGSGNGSFQLADALPAVNGAAMAFADFNGDKVLDLATGSGVQLGVGNGALQMSVPFAGAGNSIVSVAAADFNSDGKVDLAWPDPGMNAVNVVQGNGDGTFADPRAQPNRLSQTDVCLISPRALTLGDLNGDGRDDVVVASGTSQLVDSANLFIYLGSANGTLQSPSICRILGATPSAVVIGDFNRDGNGDVAVGDPTSLDDDQRPDLVVADNGAAFMRAYLNTTPPGAPSPSASR